MKKLSINISLFFVLLTLSSCNDWLDEVKQTTTVSDEIIWQDETQVDKYVNSFYPLLHDYGQFGELTSMKTYLHPSSAIFPNNRFSVIGSGVVCSVGIASSSI